MDPTSRILLKAVLNILGKQIQASNDEVRLLLQTELPKISASLSRIEDTLEENRIAPLRAAVTCLRIGDDTGALQRLIDAEAADPSAAVPSFWLGLLLYARNQHDLAEEMIAKAIRLNPTIVPREWRPTELLPARSASTDRVRWSIDVDRNIKEAASPVYGSFWGFRTGMGGHARVSGAGLSTSSLIVLAENPNPRYPCLCSINLLSGKIDWVHRLPTLPEGSDTARLLAVSPNLIAVTDPNSDRIAVHDSSTGVYIRSIGEAYLQAMIFPLAKPGHHESVVIFEAVKNPFAEPLIKVLQREKLYGLGFFVEVTNQYGLFGRPKGRSDLDLYIAPEFSTASRYDQ